MLTYVQGRRNDHHPYYREDNTCADKLVSYDFQIVDFILWDLLRKYINTSFLEIDLDDGCLYIF
jgi:hypothetical protein